MLLPRRARFDGGFIQSSPAIADGMIYVGGSSGNLYALDALTGEKVWQHSTGSYIRSSVSITNGIIYVGTLDGTIYAIGASTTSPEPSPTPSACPSSSTPTEGQNLTLSPSSTPAPEEPVKQKPSSPPGKSTPEPHPTTEPLPTTLLVASAATIIFAGSGFLLYLKKHRR